jgi:ubiquinone/menaquinone biosynthesis C-methylase UbiE
MAGYYHYFSFGLSPYIEGLILRVREAVFQTFMTVLRPEPADTILDVGVSADDHVAANHFEKRYPHRSKVCALGIDHIPNLVSRFPGLTVVQGDARALPFANNSFDFVYSHAVIEHLGSREQQSEFLAETLRVARKGVFVTTPNRWHPIESHTGLPLLHYLPQAICRQVYRALGKGMYATEDTLNLLSSRQLLRLLGGVGPPVRGASLHGVRWLGIRSNLILAIRKG